VTSDALVKSLKTPYSVIPVKTGIQSCQLVASPLDSRLRDRVTILACHCERTTVRVAIFILSKAYEIASLITFVRKDIVTQSLRGNDDFLRGRHK
jgi:hypothetical protein